MALSRGLVSVKRSESKCAGRHRQALISVFGLTHTSPPSPLSLQSSGGWFDFPVPIRESLPDVRGLPVVTSSWKCLEQLDLAVWEHARWSGDVVLRLKEALAADPDCALAHIFVSLRLLR